MAGRADNRGALHLRTAPDGTAAIELRIGRQGWALDALRPCGRVPAPAVLAKSLRPAGSRWLLPLADGVVAKSLGPQHPSMIDVDGALVEDGKPAGRLDRLAVFEVQKGADGEWFCEGPEFAGRINTTDRLVVVSKEWSACAMDGQMPTDGTPGLPSQIAARVPLALRYWTEQDPARAEARRAALVRSGLLKHVALVDGRFEVVEMRPFLPGPPVVAPPARGPLAVSMAVADAARVPARKLIRPGTRKETEGDVLTLDASGDAGKVTEYVNQAIARDGDTIVIADDGPQNACELARYAQPCRMVDAPGKLIATSLALGDEAEYLDVAPGPRGIMGKVAARKADEVANPETRDYQGIAVVIDRPIGFVQTLTLHDGSKKERRYTCDYGHIPGTAGGDGDDLDVFVAGEAEAPIAYLAVQNKRTDPTVFDEYKLILGAKSADEAREIYAAHIPVELLAELAEVPINRVRALRGCDPSDRHEAVKRLHPLNAPAVVAAPDVLPAPVRKGSGEHPTVLVVKRLPPKIDGDERIATGVVLEPNPLDGQGDLQGDTYSAEEIRGAAYLYMEEYQHIGLNHETIVDSKIRLLESYIMPCDGVIGTQKVKAGSWVMTVRFVDDELWAQVKSGQITAYSIGGDAIRRLLKSRAARV